jgi:hypothetical protein
VACCITTFTATVSLSQLLRGSVIVDQGGRLPAQRPVKEWHQAEEHQVRQGADKITAVADKLGLDMTLVLSKIHVYEEENEQRFKFWGGM